MEFYFGLDHSKPEEAQILASKICQGLWLGTQPEKIFMSWLGPKTTNPVRLHVFPLGDVTYQKG